MRFTFFTRYFVALIAIIAAAPASGGAAASRETGAIPSRNLIQNGSFEMDWMHNGVTSNTRFLLLDQSDWGYAQPDGQPDLWVLPESARIDSSAARFGKSSLRLSGEAWQVVYLCGETEPTDGGSGYSPFRPLPAELAAQVKQHSVRFGAWCKTCDAAASPTLSVTMEYAQGARITSKTTEASFSKGSHDWEYREFTVAPAPDLGAMHAAVVRLNHREAGDAWFDGVAAEEMEKPGEQREPNLLTDGNFTSLDGNKSADWSQPQLWNWVRRDYYRFTGWSHEDGKVAGGASLLKCTDVGPASQLTVLPGGNMSVASKEIELNQDKPRPLRVEARVWADNLRWLEIMAKDERGERLPQQDFAGSWGTDANYRNRIVGAGSHDWQYVWKYFAPRRPVRRLTLHLCARGFDGKLMQRDVVGTVRFTGVELRECGTTPDELSRRHVPLPPPAPQSRPAGVEPWISDLGERLWGENTVRLNAAEHAAAPALTLVSPAGKTTALAAEANPGGALLGWTARYRVTEMCSGWNSQYRIDGAAPLSFGTPVSPVSIRLGAVCLYPGESLPIGVNLNVTQSSLAEIARCRIFLNSPTGEKTLLDTMALTTAFWTIDQERPVLLREGHVNARNLITVAIGSEGLPVHPATEPIRDCAVVVELTDRSGGKIAPQFSEPFGFMDKPRAPALPERIDRTAVDARGVLRVNGAPFFFHPFPIGPAGKTDLGAVGRMLNFPAGYKISAIPFPKELLFDAAHEADWRPKVKAFAAAAKDDPKLFGYRFEHDGETMMWFDHWKEMADCQRKAASWVREADPNHAILGAEWLFGTGTLTPESSRHFDYLDDLDVEPAFTTVPPFRAIRKQSPRGQYLLAGMECYYFQSPALLRWRMYSLLSAGASDVGICPSGMLAERPETVSFLRGLYAEEACLEPMLTGSEPAEPSTSNNSSVALWEREDRGDRYLVAMGKNGNVPEEQPFEVTLPAEIEMIDALFEGRRIEPNGRKFTDRLQSGTAVHAYRITLRGGNR